MGLLLPFRSQKEKWRKMLICGSAKHPEVWGMLFAIFSILWTPLTRLFLALVFRSSSHHTLATCAPSEFPGGARSPDVGEALPPQRGSLRRRRAQARRGPAQAQRGPPQAQVLPARVSRRLSAWLWLNAFPKPRELFSFSLMPQASISPPPTESHGASPRAL